MSHETIYQSLFVQGRGALRKELWRCLRTGRAVRRPQGRPRRRRARSVTGHDLATPCRGREPAMPVWQRLNCQQLDWIAKTDPKRWRAYLLKARTPLRLRRPRRRRQRRPRPLAVLGSTVTTRIIHATSQRRSRDTAKPSTRNLEHGLSQGLIESTNTKIRLLTRIAFGFHGPQPLTRPRTTRPRQPPTTTPRPKLTHRYSRRVPYGRVALSASVRSLCEPDKTMPLPFRSRRQGGSSTNLRISSGFLGLLQSIHGVEGVLMG